MNKVYEEFGKFLLSLNLAIIIFVFVKPIIEGSFNPLIGAIFAIIIFMLFISAYFLLKKAGDKNE